MVLPSFLGVPGRLTNAFQSLLWRKGSLSTLQDCFHSVLGQTPTGVRIPRVGLLGDFAGSREDGCQSRSMEPLPIPDWPVQSLKQ